MTFCIHCSRNRLTGLSMLLMCLGLLCGTGQVAAESTQEFQGALTLDQAYTLALEHNEDIKASAQGIDQAREQLREATSPLLPQVNLSAQARRQKEHELNVSGLRDYATMTLGVSQHLYQGGKLWHSRKAASQSFAGEKSRHFRTVQDILFRVAAQYYEVLLAERSISVAREQITRTKRQLELADSRFEVGLVNRTAVLRAQVQVANAQEQLERAMNQRAVAMENLHLELGLQEMPEDIAAPQDMTFADQPMPALYAEALAKRLDLAELEKRLHAAHSTIQSEQANRAWPQLAVESGYTVTDEEALFQGDESDWHVALTASYDLFTGWRDTARVNVAQAENRQLKAEYTRLKQAVQVQVRSVYLDIKTQEKVLDSLRDQVQSAQANYEQIVAQFEEGLVSSVDVVDAQTALNEAELRLARAYYTYQLDQLRLRLATGTFVHDRVDQFLAKSKSYISE
ncbi:MAG: TolC family protein [Desulfovermiculus sp.]|nr:TolC family protein [Desulfovermiculus sp.]